jgi:diguanylate cyclase (GGDEF)-like protein
MPAPPIPRNDHQRQPAGPKKTKGPSVNPAKPAQRAQQTPADALIATGEAEDTLRAIRDGEVDAFVVSDAGAAQRVFTLSTADHPYRMFVENMRDGAATVSSAGLIIYANRRLAQLLSCPREELVGSHLDRFVVGGIPSGLRAAPGPSGGGITVDIDLVDAHGTAVPVRIGWAPLQVDGDDFTCLTFSDLRAQKAQDREIARLGMAQGERLADLQAAHAALIHQATHDTLTGLPNRAVLVDRINAALSLSARSGKCTAVLFVDLDGFKNVNDTHGHGAGDTVLRTVADHLVAVLRPMDTVARIGGDEFAVLAPEIDGALEAVTIGSRLVAELNHCSERGPDGVRVAASIGISVSVGGAGTAESLLKEADTAMYQAKSLGGGRSEVFDPDLGHQLQRRSLARALLQSALDGHRVIAYYQPIIELSAGTTVGFEALARITEPDGTLRPPADFIPVAEESRLVVPLGTQVLEMACREASNWRFARCSTEPLTVAVNLSARQFEPGNLPTLVQAALGRAGLDATCLHLELTETTIIDLRPDVLQQLRDIRDLGVQIGLDDFGTGYASLVHLRRLPLDFVKIDQSFIQGIDTDHENERIVAAVVDLAGNLGLRSVAEGVETSDQLSHLRKLGCDQAQGYLFARPLPPHDVPAAIQQVAPSWPDIKSS